MRDRPFERTITCVKDSSGHVGFQFKNGNINAIVKVSLVDIRALYILKEIALFYISVALHIMTAISYYTISAFNICIMISLVNLIATKHFEN